jgi:hypothetical protein
LIFESTKKVKNPYIKQFSTLLKQF